MTKKKTETKTENDASGQYRPGNKPVVVVGDGWAALGAVGFLVSAGIEVCWVEGTGARVLPPLASLESGPGVEIWKALEQKLGISYGEQQQGSWLKEFRNKAFRPPLWNKAPTLEARLTTRDEILWEPERRFAGGVATRFTLTLYEIVNSIRQILTPAKFSCLRRIDGIPITGFRKSDSDGVNSIILGSGEVVDCQQVIYADRWSPLVGMEGMPKAPVPFRRRDPMGVLQAEFSHEPPMTGGVLDSFFAALHREAGEEVERHVWGYFSSDGKRSIWTLCLSSEEVEDNHQIAKKLRRLKSTLDRIFTGTGFIPTGKNSFAETICEEKVRFEEEAVFAGGNPLVEPCNLPELPGVHFLTDAYGPTFALQQVGVALGIETLSTDTQAEGMDLLQPSTQ